MKKLPIGIQTFQKIREDDYVYVDKTDLAVQLIDRYQYVFLSRPRRFGKSLFLDTLHNLFEGKKELFTGLAAEKEHDWSKKYPVIKISFGGGNFRSKEGLAENLAMILRQNGKRLGISGTSASPDVWFNELIQNTVEQYNQPVVILIDEYDKPILDNIDQPEMAAFTRETLKAFYSVIKNNDAHIRFAFLTGVTKFSKVSVFSGINNIVDISLKPLFATVCGYTQHDLEMVFAEHLEGADMTEVKRWYDGYHFMGEHVYNPFDILLFLDNNKLFKSYWFETATPTFLVKLLHQKQFFLPDLSSIKAALSPIFWAFPIWKSLQHSQHPCLICFPKVPAVTLFRRTSVFPWKTAIWCSSRLPFMPCLPPFLTITTRVTILPVMKVFTPA